MNKDQIKGRVGTAKGKAKEVAGKAVGNKRLETEGRGEKLGGKAQSTYGDIKRDIKRNVK